MSVQGGCPDCASHLEIREQEAVDDVRRDQLLDESVLRAVSSDHSRVMGLRMLLHDRFHGSLHGLIGASGLGGVLHAHSNHPDSDLRVEFENGFEQGCIKLASTCSAA